MSSYFLVVESPRDKWQWRLNAAAEAKVGFVGREVSTMVDFYGQRQRRLSFDDGSVWWFYPCWLKRVQRKEAMLKKEVSEAEAAYWEALGASLKAKAAFREANADYGKAWAAYRETKEAYKQSRDAGAATPPPQ